MSAPGTVTPATRAGIRASTDTSLAKKAITDDECCGGKVGVDGELKSLHDECFCVVGIHLRYRH